MRISQSLPLENKYRKIKANLSKAKGFFRFSILNAHAAWHTHKTHTLNPTPTKSKVKRKYDKTKQFAPFQFAISNLRQFQWKLTEKMNTQVARTYLSRITSIENYIHFRTQANECKRKQQPNRTTRDRHSKAQAEWKSERSSRMNVLCLHFY